MTSTSQSRNSSPMDPDAWERIKTIFHEALALPAGERHTFIVRSAGDDLNILSQVESLLAAHDTSETFMETPAVALPGAAFPLVEQDVSPMRERVGPYRLLREVGRGGMGAVYLATRDDGQFAQRVAIKLVKRGMDTDAILARFRHERQILAALEHPNIARLLDGGTTTDGVPYFVMEYVEGQSIRAYCEIKGLNVVERLKLFRTIAAAVQHAHQNLVVHRDIKSSNIIVTPDGVPKLLDFGIAKLLTPGTGNITLATETVGAMTPEYASPEQLRGDPVTTATDVYSLGVLLYELLSGQRPFATSALRPDELVRIVSETEPSAPSAVVDRGDEELRRTLKGDLDTIVLMAMRKEPERRYSSVERFSDDLGRYLNNQPVLAQRDTWQYRTSKYVARNRVGIVVGAVLLTTLIGGLAATTWQAQVARTERARAERRFSEIRSLATSFLLDVHDSIANLDGATSARALLVKQGLTSLSNLEREANGDTILERELAVAYQRLGNVQGNSYNANLGDTKAALTSYEKSVALMSRSTDSTSRNPAALAALSDAHEGLATMQNIAGNLTPALSNLLTARQLLERALSLDTANLEYHRALGDLYYQLADLQGGAGVANVGDTKGALATYQLSIAKRTWVLEKLPNDVELKGGLANTYLNYGSAQLFADDTAGNSSIRKGVAILEDIVARDPNDGAHRNDLLSGYLRVRRSLADAGEFGEAMLLDRKVLGILLEMVAEDPKNALLQRNLAVTYNTLGFDLVGVKQAPAAVAEYRRSLAIVEGLLAKDPASAELKQDLAYTRGALADAMREGGQHSTAIAEYERAIPIKLELLALEKENPRHPSDLAALYSGLGASRSASGNFGEAQTAFTKAIPLAEKAVADSNATARTRASLAQLYSRVGAMHAAHAKTGERVERCREATAWFTKSLGLWKAMVSKKELSGANRGRPAENERAIAECAG